MTSRPEAPSESPSGSHPNRSLLTQWARLLLDSLAEAQVREVVISPGSRSTPFAAAALANPALHCTTLIDERSAAFFALGMAKASGRPTLLLCTSGSAAANYFPAVVEAAMAYTPLLVLTADRPLELDHCHASQTIDQTKFFGGYARCFLDLGAPDASVGALRALRRKAAQAVLVSQSPTPGPVHLNARARKPLEPTESVGEADDALSQAVQSLRSQPLVRSPLPSLTANIEGLKALGELFQKHQEGLIVCGPAPAATRRMGPLLSAVAKRAGYPLLVEAGSQQRYFQGDDHGATRIGALDALGRSPTLRRELAPKLILQVGSPPVAKGWSQYVEAYPLCQRFVIAAHGWNDPWSSASWVLQADPEHFLEALDRELELSLPHRHSPWLEHWKAAESLAWQAAEEVLAESSEEPASSPTSGGSQTVQTDAGSLTEGEVARIVVEALPPGGVLALGNSLPIRQVDAYSPPQPKALQVWTQRGAAGIDGVVAGASGFLQICQKPGVLLIGDVSFLHGISDLAALDRVSVPFAIVVVHNDGGRIFEQLPIARASTETSSETSTDQQSLLQRAHLDSWLTPHGRELGPAARLYGLGHHRVDTGASLQRALGAALSRNEATLIEARVPPHGAFQQNQRLWQNLEARLALRWPEPS
ncbi:MAG: 2-succinyl-5-enolpyruvyl-6-hydroxy-3-cyclohexene-1-carboxylic-acid synthase [Deltaproteobacteria bacterium]|nr:2-succinyl-5-enolpyruvyl-6-hydroxy-3-cyclohexene-1-carboxylic-acid synthase [Deltaproteobacteria bacterium]